jgi:hypothetical protein
MATMTSKSKLHRLVDELPDAEVGAAERFLQYLRSLGDPVLKALLEAPESDRPETPEEAAAVKEGREAYAAGDVVADEQLDDTSDH